MTSEDKDVRLKIMVSTIACIERLGVQSLTIRKIAQEAGVNSAAINYYFGSKERLVDAVLKMTLQEAFSNNVGDMDQLMERDPVKALEMFFEVTLEGGLRYPGITRAHLQPAFTQNDYDIDFIKTFTQFLKEIQDRIRPLVAKERQRDIKFTIMQMISAIMFPAILPGFFGDYTDMDFRDPKKRKRYIRHLIKQYLDI